MRGDVPATAGHTCYGCTFSPRARGCSPPTRRLGATDRVFPACAGMFRLWPWPRPCGAWFSPRARGCSYLDNLLREDLAVFPACAGMFPPQLPHRTHIHCFPRVRGDVPRMPVSISCLMRFSPRARGCSESEQQHRQITEVFPACAGMFLWWRRLGRKVLGFPRVRGDVPPSHPLFLPSSRFSPRARGCSG